MYEALDTLIKQTSRLKTVVLRKVMSVTSTVSDDEDDTLSYFSKLDEGVILSHTINFKGVVEIRDSFFIINIGMGDKYIRTP